MSASCAHNHHHWRYVVVVDNTSNSQLTGREKIDALKLKARLLGIARRYDNNRCCQWLYFQRWFYFLHTASCVVCLRAVLRFDKSSKISWVFELVSVYCKTSRYVWRLHIVLFHYLNIITELTTGCSFNNVHLSLTQSNTLKLHIFK